MQPGARDARRREASRLPGGVDPAKPRALPAQRVRGHRRVRPPARAARRSGRCGGSRDRLGADFELEVRLWVSGGSLTRSCARWRGRPWSGRSRRSSAGDSERAARLCEEMKHESQFMHDLLVDGIAGLISFVKERLGDEGVEEAWRWSLERSWRRPVETIAESDRTRDREVARGHLARPLHQRCWPDARGVRDRGGRREAHLHDEPVRLGPAALAARALRARTVGG